MTSKIVVNNIESDAGVSTVFFNSDIGATDGTLNVDGNLTVDGVITYEDVTNIDSVGVITARSGINVTGGSVGIGTDNPQTKLEVSSATGTRIRARHTNITGDRDAGFDIWSDDSGTFAARASLVHSGSAGRTTLYAQNRFNIHSDQTDTSLYIARSGEVGIGTDNPGTKLDVRGGNWANGDIVVGQSGNAGRIKFRRGADGSDSGSIGFSAADNNSVLSMNVASGDGTLTFQTNSVEKLRITSAGNIGINRTDPNQRLNVSGNIEVNAYDSANGSGGYYTAKGLIIGNLYDAGKSYTGSDDRTGCIWQERGLDLDFATNDALRMKITYDGEVLISNTANRFLSLDRTNASTGSGEFNLNVESNSQTTISYDDGANLVIGTSSSPRTQSGFSEKLRITSGGDVSIGVGSPEARLHVEENLSHSSTYYLNVDAHILVDNPGSGRSVLKLEGEAAIVYGGGGSNLLIADRQNERIRINEYGNTIFQGPTSTSSGNTGNAGVLIRGKTVSGSSTTVDLNISQATSNNGIGLEINESSNSPNALATLVFNHGSLKSMIACSRIATTNWGTDLRFYTHDTSTNSSNQHKVYERMRIDSDGRIFFRGLLGNAAGGSNVKYNNSDDELRYDTSSRLLKTNITECPYGIETIKKLKPSRYTPQEYDTDGNINVTDEILIGFIADEMVEEVPEVVQMYPKSTLTKNDEDTEIVPAAISYDKLTAVLTKALQEAIGEIETLKQRLTDADIA